MLTDSLELEPRVHNDVFTPTGMSVKFGPDELCIFDLPHDPDRQGRYSDQIATDNPLGFQRLMSDGISGLDPDETVSIATASQITGVSPRVYKVERMGGKFKITEVDDPSDHQTVPSSKSVEPLVIPKGQKQLEGFLDQSIFINGGDKGLGLSRIKGKLGDTVRALGFDSEASDALLPVPEVLRSEIASLREVGVAVPNIRFFKDGVISGQDYLETWADGEFPASEHPGYILHDLVAEHFSPLVAYREDAMTVATLYAHAVLEAEEIVGTVMADEYQINAEKPKLVEVKLSGKDKIDHAARCLDNFTTDLSDPLSKLDLPVDDDSLKQSFDEHPPHAMRHVPQMIRTILESPQREAFIEHLSSRGSMAYSAETDEFSYETFMRELFVRAQEFWQIEPIEPQNTKIEYESNDF